MRFGKEEDSIYSKVINNLKWGIAYADEFEMTWLESQLQPYLLSLGDVWDWVDNEKGVKTLVHLLVGELTEINNEELRSTAGYFFSDVNVNNFEVNRTRKLLHETRQFQETDIYKQLYDLADSDSASPIWLNLENCQQNRAEVRQNYSIKFRVKHKY